MIKRPNLYALFLAANFLWVASPAVISAQTLLEKKFSAAAEAEALLDLTASAPGTSWRERGAEAAVATIYVDGQYHQDVILFAGSREFTYRLMIGRMAPGEHNLRVEFNRKQSAPNATSIQIRDVKIATIDRKHPEFQAIARAPIIYARPDTIGKFSDIPLLAYYEIAGKREPGQLINDLRNYVCFDISSNQTGAAISVAVKLKGDPVWRASDWGIANYKIDRSGNFRTTALLPKRARLEDIERVVARCDVKGDPRTKQELRQVPYASCDLRSINKIFVLNHDYQPGAPLKLSFQPVKMWFGEMVEIYNQYRER